MKKFMAALIVWFFRIVLWFRYRVTVKGLENLNSSTLTKPGGLLFLPNHPTVFVDPTLMALVTWPRFPIRPMIVEYMYFNPIVNWMARFLDAIPVPSFVISSNSLKKKKVDKVIDTVIEGLKEGENFLVYPAGKIKHQAKEIIGGASAVQRIIQSTPEANVVLVRIKGLWGSSFSWGLDTTPQMFEGIIKGMKIVLKNLFLFTPRRQVTIEFVPADPDFPYKANRLDLNRYLENWYNQPDGLSPQTEEFPGDSLKLVSYSFWKEEFPKPREFDKEEEGVDLAKIPAEVKQAVLKELSNISQVPIDQITPEMQLATDLGLDSLDNAELLSFLDDKYEVVGVPVRELTTVGKLMSFAAKQLDFTPEVEEEVHDLSSWRNPRVSAPVHISEAETIYEAFLDQAAKKSKEAVCGDMRTGILTYGQMKMRVVMLAEYIRHLPGEYIGILLPSSVMSYVVILACQLAGKIPLMINWTVGSRHLEAVAVASNVKIVLSSWAFLDRLENVDLTGIEDMIVMLEDLKRKISLGDKLKGYFRSKYSTKSLLRIFGRENQTKHSQAVLLFTSGTENLPKGVPLTHENILSNIRDVAKVLDFSSDDVLLGILPPFHSFGFTVCGCFPLLAGFRVAYFPDPTDGKGVANAVEQWNATIICGTPSFLKGMLKSAKQGQLKTLRLSVTGAEKAPKELFDLVKDLGHCALLEGYGITECSPILTVNHSGDQSKGVGKALPSVEFCIVDLETHHPLPQGKQGLILTRGPNIFGGYLNKELASPFVHVNGVDWYSTGDLGFFDTEGNLILSGRLKRFAKIGGEMVSLASVEEALLPKVQEKGSSEGPILAICAREEAGEKSRLFLFTPFKITLDDLNKTLKEAGFSNLVKIYGIQQVPEIPLMGSGKINYRALETQLKDESQHALNNS